MNLHYRKYGEGNPLIILHGLFGQSDNWNSIAKKLAEYGIACYVPDLRNHGLSPHSEEMSYELMARDIKTLIDTEGLEKPSIMGHSMGGKLGMYVDYLYPDLLNSLIVVDIAPKAYSPGHTDVFTALNAIDFHTIKSRQEAAQILRQHLTDESVVQFLLKNIYWETPEKLNWRFNLKVIQNHYEGILKSIPFYHSHTKTLFVRGEKSDYISHKDWQDIQRIYRNSTLINIPNAGHWVHAEQPHLLIECILKFMNS